MEEHFNQEKDLEKNIFNFFSDFRCAVLVEAAEKRHKMWETMQRASRISCAKKVSIIKWNMRFDNKKRKFFVEIADFETKSAEKNLLIFMSTRDILGKLSGAKWGKIPTIGSEVEER